MDTIPQDVPLRQCPGCLDFLSPTCFRPTHAVCKRCERQQPKKFHHARPDATSKVCSKCRLEKPLFCFYKDKRGGILKVTSWCSLCKCPLKPENYVQRTLPLIRKCNKCGKERNIEEFAPNRRKKGDGYKWCRQCESKELIQYRQEHLEERREKDHLYYESIRVPKRRVRYNLRCLEGMICAETQARYRAKRAGTLCIEKVDYFRIYERDKDLPCYICNKVILPHHEIDFDHVIPLIRGGAHSEVNVKVTHDACNGRKHTRLLGEMTVFQRRGPDT